MHLHLKYIFRQIISMLSENEIQQHNSGGALILIGLKRSWCVHKVKAIEWDKYGMLNKQLLQTILYVHLL